MNGRTSKICVLAVLAAFGTGAACQGGSGADRADAAGQVDAGNLVDAGDTGDAAFADCLPPTDVGDADAAGSFLDDATWSWVGPYTSTRMEVTGDLHVTADLVLDASTLAVPEGCAGQLDCRQQVGFTLSQDLAGVTCEAVDEESWLSLCGTVAFDAGTTVRFRATMQDTHPSEWNFVPVIEVLPACEASCAEGDLRCPADNTCWASFQSYCRLCLEQDKTVCPCQSADGPVEDGEVCYFMVSGDVMCEGECQAGVCDYTGEPGHAGCP